MIPLYVRSSFFGLSLALCCGPCPIGAYASPLEEKSVTRLQDAQTAVDAIWATMRLTGEHAMFVSEKADVFGAYKARPDSTFKPGETLLTYIEPVGYAWAPAADGLYAFGVSLDFEILTPDGKILGGQKNFLSYATASHAKVKELMLTASMDFLPGCTCCTTRYAT